MNFNNLKKKLIKMHNSGFSHLELIEYICKLDDIYGYSDSSFVAHLDSETILLIECGGNISIYKKL